MSVYKSVNTYIGYNFGCSQFVVYRICVLLLPSCSMSILLIQPSKGLSCCHQGRFYRDYKSRASETDIHTDARIFSRHLIELCKPSKPFCPLTWQWGNSSFYICVKVHAWSEAFFRRVVWIEKIFSSRILKLKDVHSLMYLPKVDDSTWLKLLNLKKDLFMGVASTKESTKQ